MGTYNDQITANNTKLAAIKQTINNLPTKVGGRDQKYSGYMDENNSIVLDNIAPGDYEIDFGVDYEPITSSIIDGKTIIGDFIPQNSLPIELKEVKIHNKVSQEDVGEIQINKYNKYMLGKKLYNFLAISDVHLLSETSQEDFERALTFAEQNNCKFVCISGDLTNNGGSDEFEAFKKIRDMHTIPIHVAAGNHETYCGRDILERMKKYMNRDETSTVQQLYYSFDEGTDHYIMLGLSSTHEGYFFEPRELQWLQEDLEAHRNQRTFLFEHMFLPEGCGNPLSLYPFGTIPGRERDTLYNLLSHYHNVIFCHGHSHMKFHLQKRDKKANYDYICGSHSVHIPSITKPRDEDPSNPGHHINLYEGSEGYLVEVYEDGVVFKGRDFVKEKFLTYATFCLNTRVKIVPPSSYIDNIGIIKTGKDKFENHVPIQWQHTPGQKLQGDSLVPTSSTYFYTDFIKKGTINKITWEESKWLKIYIFYYDDENKMVGRRLTLNEGAFNERPGFFYLDPRYNIRISVKDQRGFSNNEMSILQHILETTIYVYNDPTVDFVPLTFHQGKIDVTTGQLTDDPKNDHFYTDSFQLQGDYAYFIQYIDNIDYTCSKVIYNGETYEGVAERYDCEYRRLCNFDMIFGSRHEGKNVKMCGWYHNKTFPFSEVTTSGITIFRMKRTF